MAKKLNAKLTKLLKYYSLINHNLILSNKTINRYKSNNSSNQNLKTLSLEKLRKSLRNINNCDLKNNATNLVFSDGNPNSRIMIIGEGPGANEDKEGLPFVGRAGQLLDKMLNAINLDRDKVYIANIIPWRPPANRKPTEEEINICLPFVHKHVELVNPSILVLLGAIAAKAFYKTDNGITQIRGNWKNISVGNIKNLKSIAIFHPAFLLRQPARKREAWEDLKKIKMEIDQNT